MKKFEELRLEEQKQVKELFANWLRPYTHEVIVRVLTHREEILNNDFVMNMLRELKEREEKQREHFNSHISSLLNNFEGFKEFNPHNDALNHPGSYRDVLYDMYIGQKENKDV